MNPKPGPWIKAHKWLLLLIGMLALLIISPISAVYDDQDNVISPLVGVIFLSVIFGTAEKAVTLWIFGGLTIVWLVIAILTEGSGIFAGHSLLAPALFMVLIVAIFVLLARWLIRAVHINTEVLCAAVCGYLLLGIFWTGLYAAIMWANPAAITSVDTRLLTFSDLLYFSFTSLTTTGFGDIIPRYPVVRMVTVMEAIVGVFYNTIVIARFVGLYGLRLGDPSDAKK